MTGRTEKGSDEKGPSAVTFYKRLQNANNKVTSDCDAWPR